MASTASTASIRSMDSMFSVASIEANGRSLRKRLKEEAWLSVSLQHFLFFVPSSIFRSFLSYLPNAAEPPGGGGGWHYYVGTRLPYGSGPG